MTRTLLLSLMLLVTPAVAGAQDLLDAAKAQYEGAAFEDALATLDRVNDRDDATVQAARRYRALCLMALGREQDAEGVLAAMITADPLLPASFDQQPPRFQALARRVREQLLPDLVRQRYTAGRVHFDRGEWADAAQDLGTVLTLIDDEPKADRGPFAETRRLAADFLELALSRHAAGRGGTPLVVLTGSAPKDTAPPVPLWQHAPLLPLGGADGVLDVLVGKRGNVESVKLVRSVNWVYDPMLLMAARMWRYRPAERDGLPVPYLLTLHVGPTNAR